MLPILFEPTETAFTSNGLGRLQAVRCEVTEERNGPYELEIDVPVWDPHYKDIKIDCFILATHDDTGDLQPFKIYAHDNPLDGICTFYAHHISYELNHVILRPFTASSAAEAVSKISGHSVNENPFTFWTDKDVASPFSIKTPRSVRAALGGQAGSLLDVYGGEYEFDKYTVKLYVNRGQRKDLTIRYRKNLADFVQKLSAEGTYNSVVPYWYKEEDDTSTLVMLDDPVVTGEGVTDPVVVPLDLTEKFDQAPTQAQLRAAAVSHLAGHSVDPDENIEIDFIALWQTEEYTDVAALERCELCDRVNVAVGPLGLKVTNVEIIKTVHNVLTGRYNSMELGSARTSLAETIQKAVEDEVSAQILQQASRDRGYVDAAIESATDLITGGLGGYVVINRDANGKPTEILIMDTASTATATNVIRMNQNGIGFSTNGYAGPYTTAWTINGAFVADFITSGTLNANLIKAGIIADDAGLNYWNMLTGDFRITNAAHIGTGSTTIGDLATKQEVEDLDDSLDQEEVFKRLTSNGSIVGIYMANGQLYVNADYIRSGTLKVGGANNVNGLFQVLNASGQVITTGDKDGLTSKVLRATDYIYVNGNDQSEINIPALTDSAYGGNERSLGTTKTDKRGFHVFSENDSSSFVFNPAGYINKSLSPVIPPPDSYFSSMMQHYDVSGALRMEIFDGKLYYYNNSGEPVMLVDQSGVYVRPLSKTQNVVVHAGGYASSATNVGFTIPFDYAGLFADTIGDPDGGFTITASVFRVFNNGYRYGVNGSDSNSPTFDVKSATAHSITVDASGTFTRTGGSGTMPGNHGVGIFAELTISAQVGLVPGDVFEQFKPIFLTADFL